ncbi:MAG: hypothetical protein FRX49_10086 [Trebouxia sp. A1-2]|nr:MAG: hypothetical protein FRX49_10086 [Trebouxia sp. A1-2]
MASVGGSVAKASEASESMIRMSEASLAMEVPDIMAKPTSALRRAGASLAGPDGSEGHPVDDAIGPHHKVTELLALQYQCGICSSLIPRTAAGTIAACTTRVNLPLVS